MSGLAEELATARLHGATITVTESQRPVDNATAYALQQAVARRLGPASIAWKVGSTSAEAQARLGTTEPGAARVPQRFLFGSGAAVPVFGTHDLWVEGEFALRLGTDLPPRAAAYTREEVEAAVDGVAPALEIVGSRLQEGLAGAGRTMVTADGGANVALVAGPVIEAWRQFDLPEQPLQLLRNDAVVAAGSGARALGDPVNVMLWLANHQRRYDGLKAGAIVSTGTCTGLVRVAPGDILKGAFGAVGDVDARLLDAEAV